MIEGYCYKIIFADGSFYWGTSQYKGAPPEKDGYYGSPTTHRKKWKQQQHSKIVLKIFLDEQERLDYEESCIRPDLNNPRCLNEHAGKGFSKEIQKKGAQASASKSRGIPRPPEVKRKIGDKLRGRKLSPEHIQKLKDAERPPITPEAIAKRVESRKGYQHSEETIIKMRESQKGKEVSDETKSKIAESVSGYNWYNNGIESVQGREHPGEGWKEGRLVDWESPRNKGMKWYSRNGEHKMFKEDPGDGWILGVTGRNTANNHTNKGKRWYNNGTINRMFKDPPEGWLPGRFRKS
jgi:hypothetical protein